MKQTLDNTWRAKTIETLEGKDFGDPKDAPTNMVKRCLQLCKIPLEQFKVEDLRLMIGQGFSLQYLVPLAVEHLRADLFVEGDYYPGDLLKSVLSVNPEFWPINKQLWEEIDQLIKDKREELAAEKISTSLFDGAFRQK